MIDISQLEDFARRCEAARADLKPYAGKALEETGEEFLTIVQMAIQELGNVDTGKLMASFTKGADGNIWELNADGLTLTIGTNVEYAKWVDIGHRQTPGRFIPGYWDGKHFRYDPGAKTGMILKASFAKGSHYFSRSVGTLRRMLPEMMETSFGQFFRRYFP